MPLTVFEVRHVRDVRCHAVHRPIGVELSIKQIARQWLLVCSARAGLGLADLADSCTQAAAAHHSLRHRRANLYAEPLGDIAVTDGVVFEPEVDGFLHQLRPACSPWFIDPIEESVLDIDRPVANRSFGNAQLSRQGFFRYEM